MNINKFYFRYVFVTIWTIVFTLTTQAQLTADPNNFSMKVNDKAKDISFSLNGTSATNVKCRWADDTFGTFASFSPTDTGGNSKVSITAINATTSSAIILFCGQGIELVPINTDSNLIMRI
jgi:hypothetical protein